MTIDYRWRVILNFTVNKTVRDSMDLYRSMSEQTFSACLFYRSLCNPALWPSLWLKTRRPIQLTRACTLARGSWIEAPWPCSAWRLFQIASARWSTTTDCTQLNWNSQGLVWSQRIAILFAAALEFPWGDWGSLVSQRVGLKWCTTLYPVQIFQLAAVSSGVSWEESAMTVNRSLLHTHLRTHTENHRDICYK